MVFSIFSLESWCGLPFCFSSALTVCPSSTPSFPIRRFVARARHLEMTARTDEAAYEKAGSMAMVIGDLVIVFRCGA